MSKRHNCVDCISGADDRRQELPHHSVKRPLSSEELFQSVQVIYTFPLSTPLVRLRQENHVQKMASLFSCSAGYVIISYHWHNKRCGDSA